MTCEMQRRQELQGAASTGDTLLDELGLDVHRWLSSSDHDVLVRSVRPRAALEHLPDHRSAGVPRPPQRLHALLGLVQRDARQQPARCLGV
eukprot:171115-Pyramimonas_sp.AAC.1